MYGATPPYKNASKSEHIKHLMAQREHLLVLRDYLESSGRLSESGSSVSYQNLVDLLEQAVDEYDTLVSTLQKQIRNG